MRRFSTALGTLTIAGAMAFGLTGTAFAADGQLFIAPNTTVQNPHGCYNATIRPLVVHNETDGFALVYDRPNCTGNVIAVVGPGDTSTQEFGASVFIK